MNQLSFRETFLSLLTASREKMQSDIELLIVGGKKRLIEPNLLFVLLICFSRSFKSMIYTENREGGSA